MTIPEWYKDEAKMHVLNSLLRDPVFEQALDLVEKANAPAFRAGVSATDLALVHSFQAGVHHVRRALVALTHTPPGERDTPGEWEGGHVVNLPTDEPE